MSLKDDINIPVLTSVGLLVGVVVVLLVLGTESLYFATEKNMTRARYAEQEKRGTLATHVRADHKARLAGIEDAKNAVAAAGGVLPATRPAD